MDWKSFCIAMITFAILDLIFLGYLASSFYKQELKAHVRIVDGSLQVNYWAAAVVYVLMALGAVVFLIPHATTVQSGALYGALMGLLMYGVYDFTNLAILANYSIKVAMVDVAWGTFAWAIVGAVLSSTSV